jgi:hypothetical protein
LIRSAKKCPCKELSGKAIEDGAALVGILEGRGMADAFVGLGIKASSIKHEMILSDFLLLIMIRFHSLLMGK